MDNKEKYMVFEKLFSNPDHLLDIFMHTRDAICFIDKEGKYYTVNPQMEQLTGYTKEELVGTDVSLLVHPDDAELIEPFIKSLLENGFYYDFIIRIITKSGKIKHVEINSNLIYNEGEAIGTIDLLRDISDRIELEENLKNNAIRQEELAGAKAKELWLIQGGFVETIATLSEYRDTDTGSHLYRIRTYVEVLVRDLAENSPYSTYLNTKSRYIEDIVLASVLHDIGKTAIPDSILLKKGKLTEDEFEIIKQHTVIAGSLLKSEEKKLMKVLGKESYLALAGDIALYHHEKWDGTGYPYKLNGREIPLSARIVAVCDVYDALTSDRPYKTAWPHEEAVTLILSERGKHFDPVITDAFDRCKDKFKEIRESAKIID